MLNNISNLVDSAGGIINNLVPIVMTLVVLAFFWGLFQYIRNKASDPGKAIEGKSIMIWGVVAIAVMASLWGLVAFLNETFGIDSGQTPGSGDFIIN